ncbi:MAG: hypothetical protein ABSB59_04045 [Streptosporangiaceae bacterium]|jgi:hypothetical protein
MHVLLEDDLGRLTVRRVSLWHRLLARVLAANLDRQLAAGARPEGNVLLAARALFLTSASYRRALAASLRRLLALSASPQARPRPVAGARSAGPFRPYVPVRRDRIARSAPELTGLADCLAARGPAPARGVALVSQLLTDGGGPLYRANSRGDLCELIEQASLALTR